MLISEARVATERPGRYMSQLCKHFAHKATVELTDDRGSIDFGFGVCRLEPADGALIMRAEGADDETLARVEDVAGRHLIRFGAKDELAVDWSRI